MELRQKIEELIAPFLTDIDAFIVDIQIIAGRKRKIVQVFVDTDEGITIDQCAEISRQLGNIIDRQGLIDSSYELQISSPGIGKSLRLLRQYRKNIGREYKVHFRKDDKINDIIAKLVSVEGEQLTFMTKKDEKVDILFNEIIETIEQLPW